MAKNHNAKSPRAKKKGKKKIFAANELSRGNTIRTTFHVDLRQHGVDCFTAYIEDPWHPTTYVPFEIDSRLYHPEAAAGGHYTVTFESLLAGLTTRGRAKDLKWREFNDPHQLLENDRLPKATPRFRLVNGSNILGSFAEREGIKHTILYATSDQKRLLFFNRRSRPNHQEKNLEKFDDLARKIFARRWNLSHRKGDVTKAIIAHKKIIDAVVAHHFRGAEVRIGSRPAAASDLVPMVDAFVDDPFLDDLLKLLTEAAKEIEVAGNVRNRSKAKWGATLYRFQRTPDDRKLVLKREAHYSPDNPDKDEDDVQKFGSHRPTISMATALAGRTHLLEYVDRPSDNPSFVVASVNLGRKESLTFKRQKALNPKNLRIVGSDDWPRLEFRGQREELDASLNAVNSTVFGQQYPGLVAALRERCIMCLPHICTPFVSGWTPGSEVCVPIFVGGQSVGCLNLEADQAYAIREAHIDRAAFLARILSVVWFRQSVADLAVATQATAEAHITRVEADDTRQVIDRFAAILRDSLWAEDVRIDACVDDLTRSQSKNTHVEIRTIRQFTVPPTIDEEKCWNSWANQISRLGGNAKDGGDRKTGIIVRANPARHGANQNAFIADSFEYNPDAAEEDAVTIARHQMIKDAEDHGIPESAPTQNGFVIGMRLDTQIDDVSGSKNHKPTGIIWMQYAPDEVVRLPVNLKESKPFKKYLQHLCCIGERASLPSAIWFSRLRELERLWANLEHGRLELWLATLAGASDQTVRTAIQHTIRARIAVFKDRDTFTQEGKLRDLIRVESQSKSCPLSVVVNETMTAAKCFAKRGEINVLGSLPNGTFGLSEIHLRECLSNLFVNALKYSRDNTAVEVAISKAEDSVVISLCNHPNVDANEAIAKISAAMLPRSSFSIPKKLGLQVSSTLAKAFGKPLEFIADENGRITCRLTLPLTNS